MVKNPQLLPPDALLLIATGCPHCPTVLQALGELVKAGLIGRLEVVNAGAHPEMARTLGVRSVPWLRLGPFELEGLRSLAELRRWAERAAVPEGMADYFRELLETGELKKVIELVSQDDTRLDALLLLLADAQTELAVRVGIGAVMEEFQGRDVLKRLVDGLGQLTHSPDAHVRGDASHYLALTGSPLAIPYLRPLLADPERQVREIAQESLETLAPAAGA